MLIKTGLNRLYRFKSFVYGECRLVEGERGLELEVTIEARRNGRTVCSGCGYAGAGCYDRRPARRYEFVPLWGLRVFFVYAPRRVNCPGCGITIERVPWAEGKNQATIQYKLFLSHWARKLSWQEVANEFRTTWQQVFRAIEYVVQWGLEHRDLSGVTAIGIDEILTNRGHHYGTLVYQIDAHCRRLLWVGKDRTAKTLLRFFRIFGRERSSNIQYVCSDMWEAYLKKVMSRCSREAAGASSSEQKTRQRISATLCENSCNIISGVSGHICSKRTFSNSGSIPHQLGPRNFLTSGVPEL